jgi:hypothetical protein
MPRVRCSSTARRTKERITVEITTQTHGLKFTVRLAHGDWKLSDAWMVTAIQFVAYGDGQPLKVTQMWGRTTNKGGSWSKREQNIPYGFSFADSPMPVAVWKAAVVGLRSEIDRFKETSTSNPPKGFGLTV